MKLTVEAAFTTRIRIRAVRTAFTITATIVTLAFAAVVVPTSAVATPGVAPSLSIDSQNPAASGSEGPRLWFNTGTIQFAITLNDNGEPAPITTCNLDSAGAVPCPVMTPTAPGHFTFTYAGLDDGAHNLTITTTDSETDVNTASFDFGVDTNDPLIDVTRPKGPIVNTTLSSFNAEFTVIDGLSGSLPVVECSIDSGAYVPCDVLYSNPLVGRYKHHLSGLETGSHTLDIRVTDFANRQGAASLQINVVPPGESVEVDMSTSTTFSAANPDLRIDVENNTSSDLRSLIYSLPDGFFGSLDSVPGVVGDGSRCMYADPNSPSFFLGCDQEVKDATEVGKIDAVVEVGGSRMHLDGKVYLTDPSSPGEPAGLAFVVDAKLGEIDLPDIVMGARVIIVPTEYEPMVYEDYIRSPTGLDTIVDTFPSVISDAEHGDIDFTIKRLTIDIFGDPPGGNQPLLTNPSSCQPGSSLAAVITADGQSHLSNPTYQAAGCDDVAFKPTIDEFELTSHQQNTVTGLSMNVSLPPRHSTIRNVTIDMPRSLVANYAAFDIMCQAEQSMRLDPEDALNGGCPEETMVGTATITTPLLITPITGNVYLEDSGGTLPFLFINVRDSTLGVNSRLRARNVLVDGAQNGQIRTTLDVDAGGGTRPLPSVPITDFEIDLPGTHQGPGGSLTPLFRVNPACNQTDVAVGRFRSYARPSGPTTDGTTSPISFTGCTAKTVIGDHPTLFTPDNAQTTDETSAAFGLSWTGAGSVTFRCSLDGAPLDANCGIGPSVTSGNVAYTGLADGTHQLVVFAGSPVDTDVITWTVDTSDPGDTTAPAVPALTFGPANGSLVADTTPTWNFTSSDAVTAAGALKFQCALDGGSFRPCGTGSPGSFTAPVLPAAAAIFNGQHTFRVRAEDEAGNVSAATAPLTITISPALAPSLSATVSDDSAGMHPGINLAIGSESGHDVRDITVSLPDDLAIDPTSVTGECTASAATAGTCDSDSLIGSAEATVQVDRSRLMFPGEIHLVEPPSLGEPSRLALIISPVVGAIDFGGKLVVMGRISPRVSPPGVDFEFSSVPTSVMDVPKSTSMTFRLRVVTMSFDESPNGVDPLFTNPTMCAARAFGLNLETHSDNTASATVGFDVSGCTQPPPVVNISAPAHGAFTNDSTPALSFTSSDPAATCDRSSGSNLGPYSDGVHSVTVTCTNASGPGADTANFTVDTAAPTVTILAPANGSSTSDFNPVLDYTVSDTIDPAPDCELTDGAVLGPYGAGSHNVTVACTDAAGNVGTGSSTFTVAGPESLGFAPILSGSVAGRGGAALLIGPAILVKTALVTPAANQEIRDFTISLPPSLRVDVSNLPDVLCESAQSAAGVCPSGSLVGSALARSSLSGSQMVGTVNVLRKRSNPSYPDLSVNFPGLPALRATAAQTPSGRLVYAFDSQGLTPLSEIALSVDGLWSLSASVCSNPDFSISGSATGVGSTSVTLNSQLSIEGSSVSACSSPATIRSAFKNRGKRSTLSISLSSGEKVKKLTVTLPSGLKQLKKALAKKLILTADGKRLSVRCFKFRSASKLEIGLCGAAASKIDLSFKSGALTATNKVKPKTKFTVAVTPSASLVYTLKPALTSR